MAQGCSSGGSVVRRLNELEWLPMACGNRSEQRVRRVVLGAKHVSLEKGVSFMVGHDQGGDPYRPVADPVGD
jgi:hypothetical protein